MTPAEKGAALCRAQLVLAKAGLCSHGIAPNLCKDRHPTADKEQA